MGAQIRYKVPYEVEVRAKDLSSNKRISNIHYLRSFTQVDTPPPAYGAVIAGGGDTTTLLGNFAAAWEVLALDALSVKYQLVQYTMRAILGYTYATPVVPINGLLTGATTIISSAVPHGLVSGDLVEVHNVTAPSGVNGVWGITFITPHAFSVPFVSSGAWTGPGNFQHADGPRAFRYADLEVLSSAAIGGVAGDALPIFSDVSVRRLNLGVGKQWRSRLSVAIVGESDNDFGKLTGAALTRWQGDFDTFLGAGFLNGGTDSVGGASGAVVLSRLGAMMAADPFTESDTWTKPVQAYLVRAPLGSQISRKPKVSS